MCARIVKAQPRTVMFFAEDPGAVNCVVPLALELRRRGVEIGLYSAGHATRLFAEQRLETTEIADAGAARSAVRSCRAERIVVGVSENVESPGLALIAAARKAGVATIGVIDYAANAAFRFRGTTGDPLAYAPDWLLVPDDWTRAEYARLGFDISRIAIVGHPQCDRAVRRSAELRREGRDNVRRRLGMPRNACVVVFVSEVSTGLDPQQYRRSDEYTLRGRGISIERTPIVVEELLDALAPLRGGGNRGVYLVLQKHPKETNELREYEPQFDAISQGGDALDVVYAADLVIGMSSMLLMEAYVVGVPTLSILPRAREQEWLPTIRSGDTPCITERDALHRWLDAAVHRRTLRPAHASRITVSAVLAANRMADFVMSGGFAASHRATSGDVLSRSTDA